jgi:hypothetical protein
MWGNPMVRGNVQWLVRRNVKWLLWRCRPLRLLILNYQLRYRSRILETGFKRLLYPLLLPRAICSAFLRVSSLLLLSSLDCFYRLLLCGLLSCFCRLLLSRGLLSCFCRLLLLCGRLSCFYRLLSLCGFLSCFYLRGSLAFSLTFRC